MRNDELGFEKPKAMDSMHQLKLYQATVRGKKGNICIGTGMRSKLSETTNFANPTDDQKLDSLSIVLLSLLCRKVLATGNKEKKK